MVVFELPAEAGRAGLRAATLGSCRVRNPIFALRERGDLMVCDAGLVATHTAPEALQSLRLILGETRIDDFLAPYVFESRTQPEVDRLARTLAGGVEAFIVEISDDKQFTYEEVQLQQNFVSRQLVKAHGRALLPWYRDVCLGRSVDEDTVETAMAALLEDGFVVDSRMSDFLRGIRLHRLETGEIIDSLQKLMSKAPGRWTVMGTFLVPGHEGAVMDGRARLNEKLARAAASCGASFFDPSILVAGHGREAALDAEGANIYEFAESFYPVVGESLAALAAGYREAAAAISSGASGAPERQSVARRRLADRVNRELIGLHRERVEEMGVAGSGLHAHYAERLRQEQIIGQRERTLFRIVDAYLPPYDVYAVMRAGLGELALLLAASGRKVIACEPNASRRAAIEEGALHLEHCDLLAAGGLEITSGLVPAITGAWSALAVGLDVNHFRDDNAARQEMRRLSPVDALLIDPRIFLRLRSTEEQDELATELAAVGFDARRDYRAEGLQWFHKFERHPGHSSDDHGAMRA